MHNCILYKVYYIVHISYNLSELYKKCYQTVKLIKRIVIFPVLNYTKTFSLIFFFIFNIILFPYEKILFRQSENVLKI